MLMATTRGKSSQPKRAALKMCAAHSFMHARKYSDRIKWNNRENNNNNNVYNSFLFVSPVSVSLRVSLLLLLYFGYKYRVVVFVHHFFLLAIPRSTSLLFSLFTFFSARFWVYLMQSVGTHFIRFGIRWMRASVLVRRRWWNGDGDDDDDIGWNFDARPKMMRAFCVRNLRRHWKWYLFGAGMMGGRSISTQINNAKFTHQW